MKFNKILVLLIFVAALSGCDDDPKQIVIPQDIQSWSSNAELKEAVQSLSEEEKELFKAYTMRAGLSQARGGEGIRENMTLGQAIESQKAWLAEREKAKERQQALAEKLKQQQQAQLQKMNEVLTASLLSLTYEEANIREGTYSDYFAIEIGFQNNTDRNISGAKGTAILKDIFGEIIMEVSFSNDDTIPAGKMYKISGSFDYNQFKEADVKLRNTEFDKLTFEWQPEVYLFENGQKLEMPQ